MDKKQIICAMTDAERIALVSGTRFMYTNGIDRLSVPSLSMSDGPHGLRKQVGKTVFGMSLSAPSTAFPTAALLACGWHEDNARRMGEAIGEECRHYGVHLLLGPGVNLQRNPLCGRNFEYFSEDPLVAGRMGASVVRGVQSRGVGACVKHFALNNSENYRFMGDSVADMRAIRELYLRPFEMVIKDAKPAAVMNAYNKIRGTFCTENSWLLRDVLRKEWGFEGTVMTDWGAMHDRPASLLAGCDLEMPGDTAICRRRIADALADGSLPKDVLDSAAERVLTLTELTQTERTDADFDAHHELAVHIAQDCAVLLKNDGALPLSGTERLLVVGDLFTHMRYQGAGSSMICPTRLCTPKDAMDARGIPYTFALGYREDEEAADEALIAEAQAACDACDTVLLFIGLTDIIESEGCDREHMRLPDGQLALIDRLLETGKPVVAVLFGGAPMELPFADRLSALLYMSLPGQGGGEATARLLYGEVCPSGRLAQSFPMTYDDVPFGAAFGKEQSELYRESIYVGYRYYTTAKRPVRFPFGFGLSYATFRYGTPKITQDASTVTLSVTVENTGSYRAAEVVQLYVKAPSDTVFMPEHELRAFAKVYLEPKECKTVNLALQIDDLRYFNVAQDRFVLADGDYELHLCSDASTVLFSQTISVHGESLPCPYAPEIMAAYTGAKPEAMTADRFAALSGIQVTAQPALPLTLYSPFSDFKKTFFGRCLFAAVMFIPHRLYKKAYRMPRCDERTARLKGALFLERILRSGSVLSMSMSAGRSLTYPLAVGLIHLANGHPLRAVAAMCRPVKAPPLPKAIRKKANKAHN